jgi:multidrug resistance efflux pump
MPDRLFRAEVQPQYQSILSQNNSVPNLESSREFAAFFAAVLSVSVVALFLEVPVGFNSQGIIRASNLVSTPIVERDGTLLSINVGRNPKAVKQGETIAVIKTLDSQSIRRSPNLKFTEQALAQRRIRLLERKNLNRSNFDRQKDSFEYISSELRSLIAGTKSRIELVRLDVARVQEAEARTRKLLAQNLAKRGDLDQSMDRVSEQQQVLGQLVTQLAEYNKTELENQLQLQKLELEHNDQTTLIDQQLSDLETELKLTSELERQVITAPVDGTVVSRGFTAGEAVKKGSALFEYTNAIETLQVEVDVPEDQVGIIKQDTTIAIGVKSYPVDRFGMVKGRVVNISRTTTDQFSMQNKLPTGTFFRVLGEADAASWTKYRNGKNLYQGMIADVRIETDRLPVWRIVFAPLIKLGVNAGT